MELIGQHLPSSATHSREVLAVVGPKGHFPVLQLDQLKSFPLLDLIPIGYHVASTASCRTYIQAVVGSKGYGSTAGGKMDRLLDVGYFFHLQAGNRAANDSNFPVPRFFPFHRPGSKKKRAICPQPQIPQQKLPPIRSGPEIFSRVIIGEIIKIGVLGSFGFPHFFDPELMHFVGMAGKYENRRFYGGTA